MIETVVYSLLLVALVFLGFHYKRDITKYIDILQQLISKQNKDLKRVKRQLKKKKGVK